MFCDTDQQKVVMGGQSVYLMTCAYHVYLVWGTGNKVNTCWLANNYFVGVVPSRSQHGGGGKYWLPFQLRRLDYRLCTVGIFELHSGNDFSLYFRGHAPPPTTFKSEGAKYHFRSPQFSPWTKITTSLLGLSLPPRFQFAPPPFGGPTSPPPFLTFLCPLSWLVS